MCAKNSNTAQMFIHTPTPDQAFETVLPKPEFDAAVAEIVTWEGYAPTSCNNLSAMAVDLNLGAIHYKDESSRFGLGSFKALGGAYAAAKLLHRELSKAGHDVSLSDITVGRARNLCAKVTLVSATDGNHGRSLAWGAGRFGAACRIYIHKEVSEGRALAMEELGATVIRIDGDYDASVHLARDEAEANGWFVISDTSWEGYRETPGHVMAGYGVMMDELQGQLAEAPTHLFVQGGVGGLAAAVAARARQNWGETTPKIVVVEPDLAACLYASGQTGVRTSVALEEETLMAGLSCGEPSEMAWEILNEETTAFMTVPESQVAPIMRLLAYPQGQDQAITAGESAIAGLAGVHAAAQQDEWRKALELGRESRVLVIGTEGATDPAIYNRLVGLAPCAEKQMEGA